MLVARRQVLVQLSDDLLALLDERAGMACISRSELVRRAIRQYVESDREAEIDRAIIEGYTRIPPPERDPWAEASALRSIREEPW